MLLPYAEPSFFTFLSPYTLLPSLLVFVLSANLDQDASQDHWSRCLAGHRRFRPLRLLHHPRSFRRTVSLHIYFIFITPSALFLMTLFVPVSSLFLLISEHSICSSTTIFPLFAPLPHLCRFPLLRFFVHHVQASKLTVTRTTSPKEKIPYEKLKFGHTFTDHMMEIDWNVR